MIAKPFKLDETGKKNSCQKIFKIKNFKQKLRHPALEAEAMRVEV